MRRVLVIALQETTMALVRPFAAAGRLPTMARLMAEGAVGEIVAVAPLTTPHSWGNILTGVGAGWHGIHDYWQRGEDGRFTETDSRSFRAPPLWSLLNAAGVSSAFLNLPLTWPPPEIDGIVVSGMQVPAVTRRMFRPQELYDDLLCAVGPWRPDAVLPGNKRRQDYLGLLRREIPKTAAAFEHLLLARPWRFAMVYFVEAAMAQHYFWSEMASEDPADPYRSIIADAYQELDAAIGTLSAAAGPDTDVFVISECGAGPLRSGVQINTWLEQQGLLRRRNEVARRSAARLGRTIRRTARALLPPGVKVALSRIPGGMASWARSSGTVLDLDWPATRVFSRGKEGEIFINLEGRDPAGVVAAGREYEDLREDVIRRLRGLVDPATGEPAVTDALRREDCFDGPHLTFAPDIIVRWRDASYMPDEQERVPGAVFVPRYRKDMSWPTTGSHRYEGMLLAAGPDIARGAELGLVSPFDLLPTWLALFGIAPPEGAKGRVLHAVRVAA